MSIVPSDEEACVVSRLPRELKSFPAGVQDDFGYALYAAQLGEISWKAKTPSWSEKRRHGIVANEQRGTWRAIYTVSLGDSIYVIHEFQQKSKMGDATPTSEMEVIPQRLKQLRSEVRNANKKNS